MNADERSLRADIEAWFSEKVNRRGSFKMPDLVDRAVEEFSHQNGFARRFVKAMARPMIYTIGLNVIRTKRALSVGEVVINPSEIEKASRDHVTEIFERWSRHMEHCGDRYVNILKMTKIDLNIAIKERSKLVGTHQLYIDLLKHLRRKLKADEKVEDRWTLEDIENEYQRVSSAA